MCREGEGGKGCNWEVSFVSGDLSAKSKRFRAKNKKANFDLSFRGPLITTTSQRES